MTNDDDLLDLIEKQRAAGEEGMRSAVDHADDDLPGWSEEAYAMIERFARDHPGGEFLGEDIPPWATRRGLPVPPDKRAWGAVIKRAIRDGLIVPTGRAAKNRRSGNSSTWRPLYESNRKGDPAHAA